MLYAYTLKDNQQNCIVNKVYNTKQLQCGLQELDR